MSLSLAVIWVLTQYDDLDAVYRCLPESIEDKENTSLDEVAEKIAELVAGKISARYQICEGMSIATKVPTDGEKQEPQADELRTVSEEALSFLDEF